MIFIIYIIFYGLIVLTLAALIFTVFGIIKIARGRFKSKGSKKVLRICVCLTIAFVVFVGGLSAFFLIRTYSLPVVSHHEYASIVVLNDERYIYSDREYPFGEKLKPIARDDIPEKILTPEWALEVIFNSHYFIDTDDDHFLYYPGMMDWLVYEKATD